MAFCATGANAAFRHSCNPDAAARDTPYPNSNVAVTVGTEEVVTNERASIAAVGGGDGGNCVKESTKSLNKYGI